jgi:hypothetical protein
MGAFGKCGGGGRRSAARSRAPLIVVLTTVTKSYSAVLVDISSTGARVRGDMLPARGEDVIFRVGRVQMFGSIVWRDRIGCGIMFDEAINAVEVKQVMREAIVAQKWGLTPEQGAALEDWESGFAN